MEFVEDYERAYKYNAILSGFQKDDTCVKNVEVNVMGDKSTVVETADGFEVEVTTTGSYSGRKCPAETDTTTNTPIPHNHLSARTVRYVVTGRALIRDDAIVECW